MSTKSKSLQILDFLATLTDRGLTMDEAVARVARDSNVTEDTIVQAIGYALYA